MTYRRTDGRTDRRAEAITIPPLKRGGDNKEEHHVTCTNWIPLYIHTRKSGS